jgi:hypothetical protein
MSKQLISILIFLLIFVSYIGGNSVTANAVENVETSETAYELQTPRIRQVVIEESRTSRRRGLVPLPMKSEHNGPFGSFHYNPDSGLKDVFINPTTSCGFQNLLSEWRDKFCQASEGKDYEDMGCRVSFGNISHRDITRGPVRGWPHISHTHGYCIDIRPMRRGAFENSGLTYRDQDYDRTKTSAFLKLAQEYGASPILFNDPNIYSRRRSASYVPRVAWSSGHDNHLHICLRPENIPADKRSCPSVQEALK